MRASNPRQARFCGTSALDRGCYGEGDADQEERRAAEHEERGAEREGTVRRGVDDEEDCAGTAHDPCDCCEDSGEQDESSSVGHELRVGEESVLTSVAAQFRARSDLEISSPCHSLRWSLPMSGRPGR